jgi:hypothetical protein
MTWGFRDPQGSPGLTSPRLALATGERDSPLVLRVSGEAV